MNHSGEPGHDDYGLPPVDIQIPDDARELDRDVQAYHRELRAYRRHQRSLRWRAPLRRSGMIVPLIAGCLVLAMVAGMVLTMLSANPNLGGFAGQPGSVGANKSGGSNHASHANGNLRSSGQATSGANVPPGPASALTRLPRGNITVAGQRVDLSTVQSAALAIIPVSCGCASVIRRLVNQAMGAGISVYLVGKSGDQAQLGKLAPHAIKGTAYVVVAIDVDNVLNSSYQAKGLTVVLVDSQHNVRGAATLRPGFHLQAALRQLGGTR
ncbi:MAG TPA: hypothetical protein VFW16_12605 [Streptosporangiaceae bacterium]|nr:hypothetical protein [Streptosporangiaceae bacterium]